MQIADYRARWLCSLSYVRFRMRGRTLSRANVLIAANSQAAMPRTVASLSRCIQPCPRITVSESVAWHGLFP